jgi:hypothetical protein
MAQGLVKKMNAIVKKKQTKKKKVKVKKAK